MKPSVKNEIEKTIQETVAESMSAFGLRGVSVREGIDHDGEPVLFVEADYELTKAPIDVAVTAALLTKLRDKLWAAGETRFPHIRHRFSDLQEVKAMRRAGA